MRIRNTAYLNDFLLTILRLTGRLLDHFSRSSVVQLPPPSMKMFIYLLTYM